MISLRNLQVAERGEMFFGSRYPVIFFVIVDDWIFVFVESNNKKEFKWEKGVI